jgi:hypothetical protein
MKHLSKIVGYVLLFLMIAVAGYNAIAEDKSGFLSVTIVPSGGIIPVILKLKPGINTVSS